MKCWIYRDKECVAKGLGLLAVRVVAGWAFVLHGWPKISTVTKDGTGRIFDPSAAFQFMGPDGPPGWLQAAAAYSEFLGGWALILGLLTPLATIMVGGTMVGAMTLVHLPMKHPFVGKPEDHPFELAALYLSIMFALLLIGPGRFSLDWLIFGRNGSLFDKPAEKKE